MTEKQTNNQQATSATSLVSVVNHHVTQDLKNSLLIVSIIANLFVLTTWVVLQVTTQYDSQLTSFLFNR